MVIKQLIAIHILPAHVKHPAVRKHPGGILLLRIIREHTDIFSIFIAAVNSGHLRTPAGNVAMTATGTEDYLPIRCVDRFNIVIRSIGQLPEVFTIDIYFIEVKRLTLALAI